MMSIVPLSGDWIANAYSVQNISLFGIAMPDIFPEDTAMAPLASMTHRQTAQAFAIFIFIHTIDRYKALRANWRRFWTWIRR